MRKDKRAAEGLRPVSLVRGYTSNAPGSVLISMGDTRVLCTACFDEKPPAWLRGQGKGWVTAEYAMLPGAGRTRTDRAHARGGRAQEISRLIGRALRAVTNLDAMGECTLVVDCDVLQADGGTRAAAITGAWLAMHDAFKLSVASGYLEETPLTGPCAAVSVGVVAGEVLLDLNHAEDAAAEVDMNVVQDARGRLIEIQGTAESQPFSRQTLDRLLSLADKGIRELIAIQERTLNHD